MTRHAHRESGSILIITLLVLGALTVLGLATITLSGMDGEIAQNARSGDQALYVAEAGVYWGMKEVEADLSLVTGTGQLLAATMMNDGTDPVAFQGYNQLAQHTVFVGPAPDERGNSVQCGLVGFSDKFGSPRFRVESTGTGPGGASRQVQAVVQLPPVEGICPPGRNVAGCTYAGGC